MPKAPMTKTAKGAFRRGTAGLRRFQFIEPNSVAEDSYYCCGKGGSGFRGASRAGIAQENATDSKNGSTNASNTNIQTPFTTPTTTAHRICSTMYSRISMKLVAGM